MLNRVVKLLTLCFLINLGSRVRAQVSQFLESQSVIRSFISAAPGYGHQSATLTVMKRLRELGFKGQFEVIYDDAIAYKLPALMMGFDPLKSARQHLPHLGLTAISLSQFQKLSEQMERIPLGITGADDNNKFRGPETLKVESYIRLQPLEWGESLLQTRADSHDVIIAGLRNVGFLYQVDSNRESLREMMKGLELSSEFSDKAPAIQRILEKEGFDLGVIYGIGLLGNIAGRLKLWVTALQKTRKNNPYLFQNGIILPIFSRLNEGEIHSLLWDFGLLEASPATPSSSKRGFKKNSVQYLNWNDPQLSESLENLTADKILLVQMDRVPPEIFEAFVKKSRIPLLVAGKNTMDLAQALGRPYINTVGDYNFSKAPPLSPKSFKILKQGIEVFHYSILGPIAMRRLTSLIRELMNENSELSQMFKKLVPSPMDKVAESIKFYLKYQKTIPQEGTLRESSVDLKTCKNIFAGYRGEFL